MKQTQELLKKVSLSELEEDLPFSILPLMYERISSKELLHSEIIASLINPQSAHGFGSYHLASFLKIIGVEADTFGELSKVEVKTEKRVDNQRRIDILLTNANKAIIIENKLNDAVDQPHQLIDYLNSITKRNYEVLKVVYLPLYEYKSTKERFTETDVINIYPKDLIGWLTKCANPICESYATLLKYVNQKNRNFMEAKKIQSELNNDELEKLIKLVDIVNSPDWNRARLSTIESKIRNTMKEYKIESIIKSDYIQLWIEPWAFWIEIYARSLEYKVYITDYSGEDTISSEIQNCGFNFKHDSVDLNKHYFIDESMFSYKLPDERKMSALISDVAKLLKMCQKSDYSDFKS